MKQIRKKRRHLQSFTQEQFGWDTAGANHRESRKDSRTSRRIIYGTLTILLVGGFIAVLALITDDRPHVPVSTRRPVVKIETHFSPPPAKPEAKSEAVIAELLGFVNDPTHAARSSRMFDQAYSLEHLETYYDQRENSLPRRILNPSVSAIQFKDRELLLVSFLDENNRAWSAPFEWDRDAYRLHWEAMTGYGEISWHEFFEDRPEGRYRMRANFFLPETAVMDPVATDHVVVLMSHPDLKHPVGVLIPEFSAAYRKLAGYPHATDIPAIVEIHWPETGAGPPVITYWFQRDWIR